MTPHSQQQSRSLRSSEQAQSIQESAYTIMNTTVTTVDLILVKKEKRKEKTFLRKEKAVFLLQSEWL